MLANGVNPQPLAMVRVGRDDGRQRVEHVIREPSTFEDGLHEFPPVCRTYPGE